MRENIQLAGRFSRTPLGTDQLEEVGESLAIMSLMERKVHEISEGQAQRVSIARATVHKPGLIAADEPTASLDDENCEKVMHLLLEQANECKFTCGLGFRAICLFAWASCMLCKDLFFHLFFHWFSFCVL